MTTAKSSFKLGRVMPVYKNLMKRNIGSMVFYGALIFVFFTLQYMFEIAKFYREPDIVRRSWDMIGPSQAFNGFSVSFFVMIAIVAPIVIATDMFGYMQNRRSVDVYHSLPLTRCELYAAHTAAALTCACVPVAVNFLIVAAASFGSPVKNAGAILAEMLCWVAISMVLVALTAFAAVSVGTVFDTAIFSIGLNISLAAVYITVLMMGEMLLYGFALDERKMQLVYKLSPVSLIIGRQTVDINRLSGLEFLAENNIAVAVWTVVGILLLLAGALIYKKRPSERAETVGNMNAMQVFLRSAGTFVVGTMLGAMFCGVFELENEMILVAAVMAGSVITYFVGDALLSRNIKALPKALPKAVITSLGVTAVMAAMIMGGLGYEGRVPAANNVEAVNIKWYQGRFKNEPNLTSSRSEGIMLQSPEAVELIINAHKEQSMAEKTTDRDAYFQTSLNLAYDLKDGSRMLRSYNGVCNETYDVLFKLESQPEFIKANHPIYRISDDMIDGVNVYNALGTEHKALQLDAAQKAKLADALRVDMLAQPAGEFDSSTKALGYVRLEIKYPEQKYYDPDVIVRTNGMREETAMQTVAGEFEDGRGYRVTTSEVLITESYKNTIDFLKSVGAENCLKNDFSKVEEAYVGIVGYQISGMGNAVNQTRWDDISMFDDEIFYHEREKDYEFYEDEFAYIKLDAAGFKKLEGSLSSIIAPYRDNYVVVAAVTEQNGQKAITGYYFAPISAFDGDMQEKIIEAAGNCYGDGMVKRFIKDSAVG